MVSRRRRRWLAAALGGVVALGILGGFEARARVYEDEEGMWFPADQPGRKYAIRQIREGYANPKAYHLNSDGFRDREFTRAKKPGTFRIAALGDSVTFAAVAPPEKAWPGATEAKLRADGYDVEIYNFAIHGYDIEQCAATLRYVAWDFEPDLIVYGYFTNDHIPTRLVRLGQHGDIYVHVVTAVDPAESVGPVWLANRLLARSALFRQIQGARVAWLEGARLLDNRLLLPDKIPGIDDTPFVATWLDRMMADAAAHSTPLLIYGIAPHVLATSDLSRCDEFRFPGFCAGQERHLHTLEAMVRKRRGLYLDSIRAWRTSGKPYFFPFDRGDDPLHPGVEGHAVLGAWLAAWLERATDTLPALAAARGR